MYKEQVADRKQFFDRFLFAQKADMICNVQFATQVLYRCPFRSVTYQQQLGRYLLKHSVKYLNHVSNTFYLAEVRCMNKKTFSFRSDRLLKVVPYLVIKAVKINKIGDYPDIFGNGKMFIRVFSKMFRHRSEEHTSELQSLMRNLVCRLLLEKTKTHTYL